MCTNCGCNSCNECNECSGQYSSNCKPIVGETYGVGAMFKLENPDYKDTQGETKLGLVTVNKPLTIQKDVSWESLKDYNDNGIVSMINYSDIERK